MVIKLLLLPAGVEVTNNDNVVTVKGPKGELTREFNKTLKSKLKAMKLHFTVQTTQKKNKTIHGTSRANLNNMVVGVSEGFKKNLKCAVSDIVRNSKEQNLFFQLVSLTKTKLKLQKVLLFEVPSATSIVVSGINKEVVGQTAAYIRSLRSPEPYKGKGIRYVGEYVRRKEGKTGK